MKILISQTVPSNIAAFDHIKEKFNASIEFNPLYKIEALSSKEFRTQRINLPDYTAVVFSSRLAIDAYFKLAEEMRFKVPETMKYFCTTEAVAMYLQKHIVYRKRKIFYGTGTPDSVASLITAKHKDEKFLITIAAGSNHTPLTSLFEKAGLDYTVGTMVKPVSCDIKGLDIASYDLIVMLNPSDVVSLYENFPEYTQGNTKFISFGKSIVKAMHDAGLEISVEAPTPQIPSVAMAIESFLKSN
ncbi:MAG: uroporphyrinogen-III synthase [Bacteroidales bacterium]|nr:uroporphyrinogen-III synthase [Bacteroidales bacterium]MBQ2006997.1 uroporphyrinogen-III synthase [Bacteroidales bacterium]MBQ5583018.1 uroporphyrinogen-III synthase [Bacteroidales bacterium]MBQ5639391.1 uroporphyrinogen-III synthase [Bacteroidales bacterium]